MLPPIHLQGAFGIEVASLSWAGEAVYAVPPSHCLGRLRKPPGKGQGNHKSHKSERQPFT